MESKKYSVRFNTTSTNDRDRWRLLEEGNEIIVSNVIIDTPVWTTHDYIEGIGDKWHITTEGILEMKGDVAYINKPKTKVTLRRHIYKTITWRLVGTIDTMMVAWIITGNPLTGLKIGLFEVMTKMTLYFLHERAWYTWGRSK
jgi:uncharacterized membrane protein